MLLLLIFCSHDVNLYSLCNNPSLNHDDFVAAEFALEASRLFLLLQTIIIFLVPARERKKIPSMSSQSSQCNKHCQANVLFQSRRESYFVEPEGETALN